MFGNFSILLGNVLLAVAGYCLTRRLISRCGDIFIKANLFGIDLCKESKIKIPESQGVICGVVFLIIMFLFIPIPFVEHLTKRGTMMFPFHEYVEFLAALLSICCMIFLGFVDDIFDLKWRHKLLLPTIASLPLLMVYLVTFDLTIIIVPAPFRPIFGYSIDIGVLYYVYMGMLAVFCTNAINIMAGINGIEVGQSLVISASVIVFNLIEFNGEQQSAHLLSLYFMIPFFAVSFGLYHYNKYPAKVFVGDTYCYFSGMAFAVVAILGHFSKTMLLFFIPQVVNFIYSVPQLFKFVPCPRHRLPRFNPETNKLEMSCARFKSSELSLVGRLFIKLTSILGLVHLRKVKDKGEEYEECNNFTIINLFLHFGGPTHEKALTNRILMFQIFCSIVALIIRYPLARLFYET